MIGVGVDYTIHFIWRYIEEMKDSGPEESVYLALVTTGRGIVFNAMSVITGFSVLLFSGFTSIRFFGYLVLISIGVCMVSALLLVPAIMLRFRPLFAEKAEDKNIVVTGGTPELKKMAR
jgi:predicted RND superfamily exporter protein